MHMNNDVFARALVDDRQAELRRASTRHTRPGRRRRLGWRARRGGDPST
jgi:hypothetical protein